jgi:hypothetical protein
MIPVMYRYFSSLADQFPYNKTASSRISISGLPTEYPVTGLTDNIRFYISPVVSKTSATLNLNIIFKLLAVLLLLIYIHFTAEKISREYGFWKGLSFLIVTLIFFRLLSYFFHSLSTLQFELFDPGLCSNPYTGL